ncbi:MAG: sigma-70 family RNA polymerase sigma factor [Eubacteriales bacterium]|nr:sigma-70 family RNA polymerase sigma factor [Eubacteriales bacterium]
MMLPLAILAIENNDDRLFFEQLYLDYAPLMMGCAMNILQDPEDAKDAVEQAVVRLIDHIDGLRGISGDKLRPYIVATVKNTSINAAIKRSKTAKYSFFADDDVLNGIPDRQKPPDERVVDGLEKKALLRAIKELPDHERELLQMKYLAELKDREIAKVFYISEASVRVYLSRSRKHLYSIMRGHGYEN